MAINIISIKLVNECSFIGYYSIILVNECSFIGYYIGFFVCEITAVIFPRISNIRPPRHLGGFKAMV